ncbi:MAG: hypothetical protein ABI729_11470 [Chitinophagales bacterium]
MSKYILIFVLLCFQNLSAEAQNYRTELLNLIQQLTSADKLISSELFFSYYPHHDSRTLTDTMSMRLHAQGNNLCYILGDHEYINNERYSLTINNAEKQIYISKSRMPKMFSFSLPQMDSILNIAATTVQWLGIKEGCRGYRITFSKGEIESEECWFSQNDSQPVKFILYYSKKMLDGVAQEPRVEMLFRHFSMESRKETASLFSENKYLLVEGKEFKPINAFRSYSLINNIR